ncbi:MAG: DUF4097 domain-containing protein [Phycisphaerae bacterium]|nr:DUF4097 domain-containing protein [Phycisphaerae bacterium]
MRSIAFLSLVVALLAACESTHPLPGFQRDVVDAWRAGFAGGASARETTEIKVGPVVDVEIDVFAGDVTIEASEDNSEYAELTVTRKAVHGFGRNDDAEASISQIRQDLSVTQPSAERTLMRITGITGHAEPWYQRVDVDLKVPRLGSVRVTTTRGHVWVYGSRDRIEIDGGDGDVRIITDFPFSADCRVINEDGDIDLRLPERSAGTFDLETVRGTVKTSVAKGEWRDLPGQYSDHDSVVSMLNNGRNRVLLRTVDGNIRVSVDDHPFQIGPYIFDP